MMKKLLYMLTTTVSSSIFSVTFKIVHKGEKAEFYSYTRKYIWIKYFIFFVDECTHMFPTYCEEPEDNHTCAHHVGVRIL